MWSPAPPTSPEQTPHGSFTVYAVPQIDSPKTSTTLSPTLSQLRARLLRVILANERRRESEKARIHSVA